MKKVKYLAMLLAAGMFAACSDNLEDTGAGNAGGEQNYEKGYVNIGINLPTTSGGNTRANNDSFDDGLAIEYNVNKVIIALFYGENESSASCTNAFQITDGDFLVTPPSNDNITSYYVSGVRMITAPTGTNKVYALALVNPPTEFSVVNTASGEENATVAVAGELQISSNKFTGTLENLNATAALQNVDLTKIANTTNEGSFFMTNAPIANNPTFVTGSEPSNFKVTTLTELDIFKSENEAEGAPNDIYVERAVAKVTVKVASNDGSLTIDRDEVPAYDGAKVTFQGWKLQTTNKKYYPVRKVEDTSINDWNDWKGYFNSNVTGGSNRFFGTATGGVPYRTYWGIDLNYTTIETNNISDNFTVFTTEPASWKSLGNKTTDSYMGDLVEYCAENMTQATSMQDNQLTSVVLKAKFELPNNTENDNLFMLNNTSAIYTEAQFLLRATAAVNASTDKLDENEKIELKSNLTSGITITNVTNLQNLLQITGGTDTPTDLSETQAQAILTDAGSNIKYYKEGVMYYYTSVIEHFGDELTPLGSTTIGTAANYTDANHLGRFGVVRNNWYELNIESVSGPGEPSIPEVPVTPPDLTNSYINARINVLSWAKRSQSVDL